MLTYAGWAVFLLLMSVLALRALQDRRAIWWAIGGLALAVFGMRLWQAAEEIIRQVAAETMLAPAPRLDAWVIVPALILLLKPRARNGQDKHGSPK